MKCALVAACSGEWIGKVNKFSALQTSFSVEHSSSRQYNQFGRLPLEIINSK